MKGSLFNQMIGQFKGGKLQKYAHNERTAGARCPAA
jgi:hypothetical protein